MLKLNRYVLKAPIGAARITKIKHDIGVRSVVCVNQDGEETEVDIKAIDAEALTVKPGDYLVELNGGVITCMSPNCFDLNFRPLIASVQAGVNAVTGNPPSSILD